MATKRLKLVITTGRPRLNSEKRLWVPHPCGFQGAGLGVDVLVLCPRDRPEVKPAKLSSRLRLVLRRVFRKDADCSRVSQKTGRGKPRPYDGTVFKDKQ